MLLSREGSRSYSPIWDYPVKACQGANTTIFCGVIGAEKKVFQDWDQEEDEGADRVESRHPQDVVGQGGEGFAGAGTEVDAVNG